MGLTGSNKWEREQIRAGLCRNQWVRGRGYRRNQVAAWTDPRADKKQIPCSPDILVKGDVGVCFSGGGGYDQIGYGCESRSNDRSCCDR